MVNPFEVFQPSVSHLGQIQVQHSEVGQTFEMLHPSVSDLGVLQIHANNYFTWTLFIDRDPSPQFLDFGNHRGLVDIRFCGTACENGRKRQAQRQQRECETIHGFGLPSPAVARPQILAGPEGERQEMATPPARFGMGVKLPMAVKQ